LADENSRVEKRAGRNHQRLACEPASAGLKTFDAIAGDNQAQRFAREDVHATLADKLGYGFPVQPPIRLDPRPLNRRPLASVEHTAVDRGPICRARHQPFEDVELANQMAFADTANRRVAGHLPDVLSPKGDEADLGTPARGRGRRFAARVSPTDDQNVIHGRRLYLSTFHVKHRRELFPQAKAAEQCVEQILYPCATGQAIKGRPRLT